MRSITKGRAALDRATCCTSVCVATRGATRPSIADSFLSRPTSAKVAKDAAAGEAEAVAEQERLEEEREKVWLAQPTCPSTRSWTQTPSRKTTVWIQRDGMCAAGATGDYLPSPQAPSEVSTSSRVSEGAATFELILNAFASSEESFSTGKSSISLETAGTTYFMKNAPREFAQSFQDLNKEIS